MSTSYREERGGSARIISIVLVSVYASIGAISQAAGAPTPQASATRPSAPPLQAATDTLAALVAELEHNSPELQAARRDVDMRVARIAPAGALPDPTLAASSMGGFGRPPFFPSASTVNGFWQLSLAQEFPFPGKRGLRTAVAATDVEAERWNFEDRRRRLIADLKDTYLQYASVVRSLAIVSDNRKLADELRQVAEARFSVGKGVQQDVIKAQLEISMLIERQTILEQQVRALTSRLNALLFRPADAPPMSPLAYTIQPLPGDLPVLQSLVATGDAALQRDAKVIEKSQRSVELAKRDLRPDFRLGVTAQRYTGDMPWMYGVDFMLTLPVYAKTKQRPLIAEAAASLAGSQSARESTRTMAVADVTEAYLAMTAADQLLALYTDSVLPQARLSLESSLSAYQVGTVDFLSVLTSFEAVLAAETARVEQQTRREQALVRLEPLLGLEFVK